MVILSSAKDNGNYSWIARILFSRRLSNLIFFFLYSFFSFSFLLVKNYDISRIFIKASRSVNYDHCCRILIDSFSSIFTLLFHPNFHQVNLDIFRFLSFCISFLVKKKNLRYERDFIATFEIKILFLVYSFLFSFRFKIEKKSFWFDNSLKRIPIKIKLVSRLCCSLEIKSKLFPYLTFKNYSYNEIYYICYYRI